MWSRVKQHWLYKLMVETGSAWNDNNTLRLGAALAYYAVFSMGPLLIIVVAVAGFVWGRDAAQGALFGQLRQLLGAEGAAAMQTMLASTSQPATNVFASIIGGVTLFIGASAVFIELKDALNLIWKVPPKASQGIWRMIRGRLMSFAMILALGFLLLISLVMSALLVAVSKYLGEVLPIPIWAVQAGLQVTSAVLTTVLFAMMFKILPDTRVQWRDVWVGAVVTSLLFAVGKSIIGLYLGQSSTSSAYGAAGSVVVIMLWTFYSAQILFFGAEFSEAYSRLEGSKKDGRRADAVSAPTRRTPGAASARSPGPDRS